MKALHKILLSALLVVMLIVVMVQLPQAVTTLKARLNIQNPANNAWKLGSVLQEMKEALQGDNIVLSQPSFTDSVKQMFVGAVTTTHASVANDVSAALAALTATTHDVDTTKWASYKISVDSGDTLTITISASEYATEDSAISALASTPGGEVSLGYFTIQATTDDFFDATTDSLVGLTTDNVNFYPVTSYIGVDWE